MWRSYVTVGIRALAKSRIYAFINILGLAIGLAACLLLLLYVRYERSYDEWLPNVENVYQLQTTFRDPGTGQPSLMQVSPYVAGERLEKDFPQIEEKVYLLGASPVVMRNGEALVTENVGYADGNLFSVLQVPFVRGDRATALDQLGSVVLSRTEAQRLFGDADPLNRRLTLVLRGRESEHRVTGVMQDLPKNSHHQLDMVVRSDVESLFADNPNFLTSWGANGGFNYIRLRPGTDPATINDNMGPWEERNIPDEPFGGQMLNQGDYADWRLVNLTDVHLGEAQVGAATPGNDEGTILTFTIIAFLILGMACVNFINLATARASARAREVALRKVLGANRSQLMTQFLLESVLVASVAMLLALALVELLLPLLAGFLDADLRMRYFGADGMLLPILLLTALVGAAGGVYPAFYLSRFQPAQVLKSNKSTAEAAGSGQLRNALVIAQFAVSIGLIICTAIVYAQTVHARSADPGFKREGLMQIDGMTRRQLQNRVETLIQQIERVPGVTSVARTDIAVAPQFRSGAPALIPGRSQPVVIGTYTIDDAFVQTAGMQLLAGRELSMDRELDVQPLVTTSLPSPESQRAFAERGLNIVINERAAREIGFADPAAAVGTRFRMGLVEAEYGTVEATVVGVLKDARLRSMRNPIEPTAFVLARDNHSFLLIRYDDPDPGAVRERIEQVWRKVAPDVPFKADFSEDLVAELYAADLARAQIFAGFAILAVIVACLGLFGLAAFTAERRTKEIGIRKVLGARSGDIVRLLAWQFSKPVIIANLIAWPVAWYAMSNWLSTFDSRVDLGVTPFLLAGLLALVIAIGTISGHAIKVARANPIHALRYE